LETPSSFTPSTSGPALMDRTGVSRE
jgi:hypothetical protein